MIYQCELCQRQYPNPLSAKQCEGRGLFDDTLYLPGMILNLPLFEDHLAYIIKRPYRKKRYPHFGAGRLLFWPKDKQFREKTLWTLRNLGSEYGFDSQDKLMELAAYIKEYHKVMPSFFNKLTNQVQIIEP